MMDVNPWDSRTESGPETLFPAVVQHADTRQVLMLAYLNRAAYELTVTTRLVTFYSRSRSEIWVKGKTSGNMLDLVDIKLDCDADAFLILARPRGPVCHTGDWTCFAEARDSIAEPAPDDFSFLLELQSIIDSRRLPHSDERKSYVASLFSLGIDRMAQKVGEEAVETVIAAKNDDSEKLVDESADLLFHLMVLLRAKGGSFAEVVARLKSRHRLSE